MASIYSNKPRYATKIFTVKDALDSLTAYNAMRESAEGTASVNNCSDLSDEEKASFRKAVKDGVINTGGAPTDLDFFEEFSGGPTTDIQATDIYIKYRGSKDWNIAAQANANGLAPGQGTSFTLLKSLHAVSGKYSNVSVGGNIYIYEDDQWCEITAIDKTTDFAHLVTVVPRSVDYTVNIRRGKKMMFNPVRFVNGLSCSQPANTWELPGYVAKVSPYRMRHDWELALDLMAPAQDIMQFALTFDNDGMEMENYEAFEKSEARDKFRFMKNLTFMFGQKTTNPALTANGQNQKYAGFMGYLPSLKYGGGTIYDIDPTMGFDFDADGQSIIVHQDSQKKGKEFIVAHGLQFAFSMIRKNTSDMASCTFESFKRMGKDGEDIAKLGITSYAYMNHTFHFRLVDAWSDKRSIGNGANPYMAVMMPGTGIKDSKGRSVPAIEFFAPGGTSSYYEVDRDHRKLESGCDKISGSFEETIMMAVHGIENHILINPVFPVA